MTAFETDLNECLQELDGSWEELYEVVSELSDADLSRGLRGEWNVLAVLRHVTGAELEYARMIAALRGQEPSAGTMDNHATVQTLEEARVRLDGARIALRESIEGVDEDIFYALRDTHLHQEYSVRSVILDAARHRREHAAQVRRTLEAG